MGGRVGLAGSFRVGGLKKEDRRLVEVAGGIEEWFVVSIIHEIAYNLGERQIRYAGEIDERSNGTNKI